MKRYICTACEKTWEGELPRMCPNCGSEEHISEIGPCSMDRKLDKLIELVTKATKLNMAEPDFNAPRKSYRIVAVLACTVRAVEDEDEEEVREAAKSRLLHGLDTDWSIERFRLTEKER